MVTRRVHKQEVGIRELRANLSTFIDAAKRGHEVVITEHGRPVARLLPSSGRSRLDELIEQGLVRPPLKARTAAKMPTIKLRGKGPSMAEIVSEQRR